MTTITRTIVRSLLLIAVSSELSASPNATGTRPADSTRSSKSMDASNPIVAPQKTLADALLAFELEGADAPEAWQKLNSLIATAVAKFGHAQPQELEAAKAMRFFRAVDEALIEGNVIFPPTGTVELLRDALERRQPTDRELRPALQNFANARRSLFIQFARAHKEPLYYFDCDLAAIIYVSAAEQLGLPVFLVELPGHNFVRWQSPAVTINWDPNDGISKSDQHFAQVVGVTAEGRALFGYLENRTRERIFSYWLVRRGQRKARDGNFAPALADFRAAVKVAPDDLVAWNELAWLLATSPDRAIRDGREACEIADKIVTRSRQINWLETAAAASSETGDFPRAVAMEAEARQMAAAWLQTKRRTGSLGGFDLCLKAYRQNLSYASAIKSGLIK